VSQELRLRSSAFDDRLDYEGGLYYTKEDNTNRIPGFRPFSTTTGADYALPSIVKASIDTSYKEYSLFANATYAITPQFDLLARRPPRQGRPGLPQDYSGLLVGPAPVLIDSGSKKTRPPTWPAPLQADAAPTPCMRAWPPASVRAARTPCRRPAANAGAADLPARYADQL
jgi:iron complex outermembrane receptor protein